MDSHVACGKCECGSSKVSATHAAYVQLQSEARPFLNNTPRGLRHSTNTQTHTDTETHTHRYKYRGISMLYCRFIALAIPFTQPGRLATLISAEQQRASHKAGQGN